MARLYLFAEGQTEQTFADEILCPHLANFGVYLIPAILVAHARRKGRTQRGGVTAYAPIRDDIQRMMRGDKSEDVYFTTMLDLYALPKEFPGMADAEQLRPAPDKRVAALEQTFAEDIADRRFVPYIQLHEYEALLFADPAKFGSIYTRRGEAIAKLIAIAAAHESPEQINDGRETAPGKRIIAVLPEYKGAKPVAGPLVAAEIGLPTLREKCPHFASWVSRLEQLGG